MSRGWGCGCGMRDSEQCTMRGSGKEMRRITKGAAVDDKRHVGRCAVWCV